MRYQKPIYTQRGITPYFSNWQTEKVLCPWCHQTTEGHYTDQGLVSDEWCQHFCGWVSAGSSQVAANFSGPADEMRQ